MYENSVKYLKQNIKKLDYTNKEVSKVDESCKLYRPAGRAFILK